MKQRVLLVGLAVVLVVALAGCGDDGNNLDGRWEAGRNAYEFSGRNFIRISDEVVGHVWEGGRPGVGMLEPRWEEVTRNGTFSISGDYIEFVYADSDIVVHPFSRTENTIVIGQTRYTRASGGGSAAPAAAAPAPPAAAAPAAPAAPDAPAAPTPEAPVPTVGYGELDGWWLHTDDTYGYTLLELRGNNFIAPHVPQPFINPFSIDEGRIYRYVYMHNRRRGTYSNPFVHTENTIFWGEEQTEFRRISGSGELDGLWITTCESRWEDRTGSIAFEFQGNYISQYVIYQRGTFTIDGDRIELIGDFRDFRWHQVFDFSHIDENTIIIDGNRLNRVS